eukprot:TRINITY_DN4287_c0_g1_i1.p2 TRINITY_DN4287_c0_g1~~TRINITY_DN4287_c0_g1_i1.p2  ORF type:complete len:283 (-),score=79.07 TRINITY_DN4287_c0_g1_i1:934-1782(-)
MQVPHTSPQGQVTNSPITHSLPAPPIHMMSECYVRYKKEFRCQYCHKSFEKRISVNRHIKNIHEATREYVECYICHKNFAQKHYLATHIKTVHDGVKDFKCMYCEKEYGQKSQLNMHVKSVHQRIRDCACPDCDKTFSKKDTLKFHLKSVHQGIRDFKCDVCSKSFALKTGLKSHVDTVHNGIKKFKCGGCNKPYALKQGLKLHTCSHSKSSQTNNVSHETTSAHPNHPTQVDLKPPTYATLNPTATKVAFPAQHAQQHPQLDIKFDYPYAVPVYAKMDYHK